MAKLNQARRDLIWNLVMDGMSYAEAGQCMHPPISKQAVHQLYMKACDEKFEKMLKVFDDKLSKGVKRTRA